LDELQVGRRGRGVTGGAGQFEEVEEREQEREWDERESEKEKEESP